MLLLSEESKLQRGDSIWSHLHVGGQGTGGKVRGCDPIFICMPT